MKKTLYTLDINYPKDITDLTYPYMQRYAEKIGADFHIINQRKSPDYPITYEKLQIANSKSDWNVFIDADCLIHPDAPDLTTMVSKDTVLLGGYQYANTRFRYDNYFMRDNRNIAMAAFIFAISDMCLDMVQPIDMTAEEASQNIFSGTLEKNIHTDRDYSKMSFAIDEYTMSRNIARYGLKVDTLQSALNRFNDKTDKNQLPYILENFFHHNCWIRQSEKSMLILKMIHEWNI
jgi:hypothetical protein